MLITFTLKRRDYLEVKMLQFLAENVTELPNDIAKLVADDLVTAMESRVKVAINGMQAQLGKV